MRKGRHVLLVAHLDSRPKENHVFEVLHYIKAAFKKHALDKITESDCFNKDAFRYVIGYMAIS